MIGLILLSVCLFIRIRLVLAYLSQYLSIYTIFEGNCIEAIEDIVVEDIPDKVEEYKSAVVFQSALLTQ